MVGVFGGLGLIATLHCLVGHHHCLAGVAVGELFHLDHRLFKAHLGLLLVRNEDIRGLFLQALMLLFALPNRLLQLDLWIRVLLELRVSLCGEVLPPPFLNRVDHGANCCPSHERFAGNTWPLRRSFCSAAKFAQRTAEQNVERRDDSEDPADDQIGQSGEPDREDHGERRPHIVGDDLHEDGDDASTDERCVYWQMPLNQESVQDRVGLMFFLTINQAFPSMFGALQAFEGEKKIFVRERASGFYRVSS